MSAKDEADIKQLQGQMREMEMQLVLLNSNCLSAVGALSERLAMLEIGENNAVVEGDEIQVKAAPNGQIKAKKAHR